MSFDLNLQERLSDHLSGVAVPRPETEFIPRSPGGRHPRELEIHGVPVVIVDPHNEAFYYWAQARDWQVEAPTLIHIDAHSDTASADEKLFSDYFKTSFRKASPEDCWRYTQELNIAQFIEPAAQYRVIKPTMFWYDAGQPKPLQGYRHDRRGREMTHLWDETEERGWYKASYLLEKAPVIWDIDLDAFSLAVPGSSAVRTRPEYTQGFFRCTEAFFGKCAKPVLVTIAESQTPETYVPPSQLDSIREQTIEMLERLLQ